MGHFVLVRRGWRVAALLGLALGALLAQVAPAGALAPAHPHAPRAGIRTYTELTWNGDFGPIEVGVRGFILTAPVNPPIRYPTSDPTTDFTVFDEPNAAAGVILGTPTGGTPSVKLYCIDIHTDTNSGFGYALGTWDSANVPNVGFVARLLNEYYPTTQEPSNDPVTGASLSPGQTAAAVQEAIWFFSDSFVLSTSDPLYNTVAAIANHIIAEGPLKQPPPPSLTITPPVASGPVGGVVGPFTVNTSFASRRHRRHRRRVRSGPDATVTATGGDMFSNAAGTNMLPNPATVHDGQQIWVRSTGPASVALGAIAEATVPTGNVYLYSNNIPNVVAGQKFILAATATLTANASATANFKPSGSLVVTKTIAGPAAGSHGRVVIHADCNDGVTRPDFVIDAGTGAGTTSHTYSDIPFGTVCTVAETADGSVAGTDVVVTGDGQQVSIPSDASATVRLTDTYHAIVPPTPPTPGPPTSGSLVVTKTIAGPLAGHQGLVTIHTVCNGTALSPDLAVNAGTSAGSISHSYDGIPGGSVCTVTETADGATATVTATVSGGDQQVTVPAGEAVPVHVTDVYQDAPGSIRVIKDIKGPAAHLHGRIAILVACGGQAHAFLIPAHNPTGPVAHSFDGLPAGGRCTVTEVAIGRAHRVVVVAVGRRQTVTVRADGTAVVHLSDRFTAVKAVVVAPPPRVTG